MAPPITIGLRTNAMIACYQQIRNPAKMEITIMRAVSARVARNSVDIPFNATTFSEVIVVILPGALFSLSNQLIYLWNNAFNSDTRTLRVIYSPISTKHALFEPPIIKDKASHETHANRIFLL